MRAPVPLTQETLAIGVNGPAGTPSALIQGIARDVDEDPGCAGTFLAPTAPAGRLCAYVRESTILNVVTNSLGVFQLEVDPSPRTSSASPGSSLRWRLGTPAPRGPGPTRPPDIEAGGSVGHPPNGPAGFSYMCPAGFARLTLTPVVRSGARAG